MSRSRLGPVYRAVRSASGAVVMVDGQVIAGAFDWGRRSRAGRALAREIMERRRVVAGAARRDDWGLYDELLVCVCLPRSGWSLTGAQVEGVLDALECCDSSALDVLWAEVAATAPGRVRARR